MFPYVNFGRIAAVVAEDSPAAPAMVLLVGRCEDLPAFVAGLSVLLSHPSNRGHPGLTAMPPIHLCFGYCMPPRPANNTDFSNEHTRAHTKQGVDNGGNQENNSVNAKNVFRVPTPCQSTARFEKGHT